MGDETEATSEGRPPASLGYLLVGRLVLAGLSLGLAVAIDRLEGSGDGAGLEGVYWTIVAAFGATIVSALMVSRASDPGRFSTLQVGVDITIVTALVYFSGGGESFFTFLYALVVLYGALFLDRGGVALACGLAAAGYGTVLFGSELGLLPHAAEVARPRPLPLLGAYWGFYAGALLVLGMLANTLSAELRRTGAALDRQRVDLQRLQDLHKRTVDSIGSGLLTIDEEQRVTSFNPEAERITGLRSEEASGRRLDSVIPGAGAMLATDPVRREGEATPGRERLPYRSGDGEDLFLGLAASRLFDESGEQMGHVVIFQDVTRVVSMERDLRSSERLAAVGEMAARIAHEIRNPLASISGSVQILQSGPSHAEADPEQDRLMGIVVREVDRLNGLISDFLRYSRPAPMKLESVALADLVREVAEMDRSRREEVGGIVLRLEIDEVRVLADPAQLTAILWNLWNNAIEAMVAARDAGTATEDSTLTVRVRRIQEAAGPSQATAQVAQVGNRNEKSAEDGGVAVLEVEDTGPGLDSEAQERLFEPFFTTKQDGTGLGLAMVQRLVEQHGGGISAHSEVGVGTCFRVTLSLAEAR